MPNTDLPREQAVGSATAGGGQQECIVCHTACPVPTPQESAETLDDELVRLAAMTRQNPADEDEEWLYARDAFVLMQDVYASENGTAKHPAMVVNCALRMEGLADDLTHAAKGESKGLCWHIHCLTELVLFDAECCRDKWTDEELDQPPTYKQRPEATFAECDTWDKPPLEELAALAELLAQDSATESEWSIWRDQRDTFLKFYGGFCRPGLHPAVADYYAREMSRWISTMCRYASWGDHSKRMHERAERLLWEIVDDAADSMYGHDAADMEYTSVDPSAAVMTRGS